jgi:hypothetical protein
VTNEELLRCARELVVVRPSDGMHVYVTRYTNHGALLNDGMWMAMIHANCPDRSPSAAGASPFNPFYLTSDGHWRYKAGAGFKSLDDALAAVSRAHTLEESWAVHP